MPARVGRELDKYWGRPGPDDVDITPTTRDVAAFATEVQAKARLSATPVLLSGLDTSPLVYAPQDSGTAGVVRFVYPSRKLGWFGIWISPAPADPGEVHQSYLDAIASCASQSGSDGCQPSSPKLITLDTGMEALLNDPGGVDWVQGNEHLVVAGPWATFGASESVPLANALSRAIAAAPGQAAASTTVGAGTAG